MPESSKNTLPETWELTNIGTIYEVVGGGTPTTTEEEFWNGDVPWITSADIRGVRRVDVTRFVTDSGIEESATNKVPVRTLLVVTRVGLGKIAIADREICFSQDIQGLVQDPELVLPEYALYYLSYQLQRLKYEGRGTTISGLTKKQLKDTVFPLAPRTEQLRIFAKLEELFSELDKGVESLKSVKELLKAYRESVLKYAFEGKLTEQWRSRQCREPWTNTTLGEQLSLLTSGSRGWAKYYSDEGDIFIRAQNLKYDRLDLEDPAYVDLPEQSEGKRTRVQVGDLLITITGANVTKTASVQREIGTAYVSQHVALARPVEGGNTEFLYWFLVAEAAGRSQLKKMAYGAGKPGLNLDNIRSVEISLPAPDEQAEIASQIRALLSIEQNVSVYVDAQIRKCDVLRQSILKRAFCGQLVGQAPNDEPASSLLERIKAEKNGRAKDGKKNNKVRSGKDAA